MADKRLLKLVDHVLRNPKNVDFEDLKRLLEGFGFVCHQPGGGSSHYTFRKSGEMPITVPKKKPVNAPYVRAIIKRLGLEDWDEKKR